MRAANWGLGYLFHVKYECVAEMRGRVLRVLMSKHTTFLERGAFLVVGHTLSC